LIDNFSEIRPFIRVLSQEEWENLPWNLLDHGVTDTDIHICRPLVLHCMHNAERFSKFAFAAGEYKDLDMSNLDLNNVRDYTTYMALTANSQGQNGELALERINGKMGNLSWNEYCQIQQLD